MRMPVIFVSHGAPDLVLAHDEHADFLRGLAALVPRPEAILVVSGHWTTAAPVASIATRPETIHDFAGFGPQLEALDYPCPGAPAVARRAAALLAAAGIACTTADRGLDHGAWCPAMLAWPQADVPVAQISVQPDREGTHALAMGAALASLRDEGVLVLGSGGVVHNLGAVNPRGGAPPPWAAAFSEWVEAWLVAGDTATLAAWRQAPNARQAHPTPEHFLPLLVTAGCAAGDKARILHQGWSWGSLAMTVVAWGWPVAVA
jgi:4,5-DOPA dioxygenase extradiol